MANSASALKRVRQNETRAARNKSLSTRMKTLRKKTLASAEAGDKDAAQKTFSEFASAVDKCAKNNIIHKNKAANLKSKTQKHLVG
ncbi:30S ribosomal protein S20 [Verrucomicrobiaceae bacterium R5-34]|uniref:Small ribosomal subunit protein bS20 n=1 Tax=Oceaniferula flava TaxID=2800421 RepID=A0AAE2SB13_9BACT|nr:30S ribosomal protein S20 [Oceaniferula flavus]MBK1830312.1 30S ribosomal protein S20 [Verrucomicrobiaceae bacterium R5-34]MBK1854404.1 30S ribosomal protein S20 [Oceaniferula flavus]MBM1135710.1 30S ribosomal protein S20 [Oceaniferula flavus]